MIKRSYQKFFKNLGVIFGLAVAAAFVINLATPQRSFSEKENRVLQQRPKMRREQMMSGAFAAKFESFVNDQFVLRDFWVTLKAGVDVLLGKVENSGVYLGKDGYLMEAFTPPSEDQLTHTLTAMTDFASAYGSLPQYVLIAPNSVNILSKDLPANAPVADQNPYLDRVQDAMRAAGATVIDTRDTLRSHSGDQLYYHTDHHWTTLGAYYAFREAASVMGWDADIVQYEQLPASKAFQGTLSAKSGFRSNATDEIDVFLPIGEDAPVYLVNYVSERERVASFYATEQLKTRDKYAMFLNGNHAQVKISTNAQTDKTLLILKDSYANCFVPFLTPYYREIILIDPRYYFGDLGSILQAEGVDEILYLYNANTFFGDTSLEMTLNTASGPAESQGTANEEGNNQSEEVDFNSLV